MDSLSKAFDSTVLLSLSTQDTILPTLALNIEVGFKISRGEMRFWSNTCVVVCCYTPDKLQHIVCLCNLFLSCIESPDTSNIPDLRGFASANTPTRFLCVSVLSFHFEPTALIRPRCTVQSQSWPNHSLSPADWLNESGIGDAGFRRDMQGGISPLVVAGILFCWSLSLC